MSGSRYWTHGDYHFGYATEPTVECPLASPFLDDAGTVTLEVEVAAQHLGADVDKIAKVLQALHRRVGVTRARDDGGKLVMRCAACGHRLTSKGYRAYVDELVPERERTADQRGVDRLNRSLFGNTAGPRRLVRQTYATTKKEAREWAWKQRQRAAAGERIEASA